MGEGDKEQVDADDFTTNNVLLIYGWRLILLIESCCQPLASPHKMVITVSPDMSCNGYKRIPPCLNVFTISLKVIVKTSCKDFNHDKTS